MTTWAIKVKHYNVSMADEGTTRRSATRRASAAAAVRRNMFQKKLTEEQGHNSITFLLKNHHLFDESTWEWIIALISVITVYCVWISSTCRSYTRVCKFVRVYVGWNSSKAYLLCRGCHIDSLQPPWPTYNKIFVLGWNRVSQYAINSRRRRLHRRYHNNRVENYLLLVNIVSIKFKLLKTIRNRLRSIWHIRRR